MNHFSLVGPPSNDTVVSVSALCAVVHGAQAQTVMRALHERVPLTIVSLDHLKRIRRVQRDGSEPILEILLCRDTDADREMFASLPPIPLSSAPPPKRARPADSAGDAPPPPIVPSATHLAELFAAAYPVTVPAVSPPTRIAYDNGSLLWPYSTVRPSAPRTAADVIPSDSAATALRTVVAALREIAYNVAHPPMCCSVAAVADLACLSTFAERQQTESSAEEPSVSDPNPSHSPPFAYVVSTVGASLRAPPSAQAAAVAAATPPDSAPPSTGVRAARTATTAPTAHAAVRLIAAVAAAQRARWGCGGGGGGPSGTPTGAASGEADVARATGAAVPTSSETVPDANPRGVAHLPPDALPDECDPAIAAAAAAIAATAPAVSDAHFLNGCLVVLSGDPCVLCGFALLHARVGVVVVAVAAGAAQDGASGRPAATADATAPAVTGGVTTSTGREGSDVPATTVGVNAAAPCVGGTSVARGAGVAAAGGGTGAFMRHSLHLTKTFNHTFDVVVCHV